MTDDPEDRELIHLEMGLRAFSEEPECPKCGARHMQTIWHPVAVFQAEPMNPCEWWVRAEMLTGLVGEHLCRVCGLCGYGWPEQTADAG